MVMVVMVVGSAWYRVEKCRGTISGRGRWSFILNGGKNEFLSILSSLTASCFDVSG